MFEHGGRCLIEPEIGLGLGLGLTLRLGLEQFLVRVGVMEVWLIDPDEDAGSAGRAKQTESERRWASKEGGPRGGGG